MQNGLLFSADHVCPADYVKCPGAHCIPPRMVCDGEWNCPSGEDEADCGVFRIVL